jgi:hypothetical protein
MWLGAATFETVAGAGTDCANAGVASDAIDSTAAKTRVRVFRKAM